MYYAIEGDDEGGIAKMEHLAPNGVTQEFLDAIAVFEGDLTCCRLCHHNGKQCCDREELVSPMLGLYAEIYANRHTPEVKPIFEAIEQRIDTIYPRFFEYKASGDVTYEKPLFGDLVQVIRGDIDSKDNATLKPIKLGKLQAGTNRDLISLSQSSHGGTKHGISAKHGIPHGISIKKATSIHTSVQEPVSV
jgi:hypothetical protein